MRQTGLQLEKSVKNTDTGSEQSTVITGWRRVNQEFSVNASTSCRVIAAPLAAISWSNGFLHDVISLSRGSVQWALQHWFMHFNRVEVRTLTGPLQHLDSVLFQSFCCWFAALWANSLWSILKATSLSYVRLQPTLFVSRPGLEIPRFVSISD